MLKPFYVLTCYKNGLLTHSSGQEGTLAGLEDRAQEQMFDLTQKVHCRTPNSLMMTWKVLCALLKKNIPITESILIWTVFYAKRKMTKNLKCCRLFFKEWETSALMLITMNQAPLENTSWIPLTTFYRKH